MQQLPIEICILMMVPLVLIELIAILNVLLFCSISVMNGHRLNKHSNLTSLSNTNGYLLTWIPEAITKELN